MPGPERFFRIVRQRADHRDRTGLRERQERALVLEQNDGLSRNSPRQCPKVRGGWRSSSPIGVAEQAEALLCPPYPHHGRIDDPPREPYSPPHRPARGKG